MRPLRSTSIRSEIAGWLASMAAATGSGALVLDFEGILTGILTAYYMNGLRGVEGA